MLGLAEVVWTARRGRAASARWELVFLLVPCADRSERAAAAVEKLVEELGGQGLGAKRLALLGFSQGGCLALEFAARDAPSLSAGFIGAENTSRAYAGSLAGTHVFLGCSDIDAHIPLKRVQDSARALRRLEGDVVEPIYPGMGHTINDDEIGQVRAALVGTLYPD